MLNRFQKWALLTVASTYFLIAVGGFVRAMGAGMGCPDWPRCFDRWIPPTDLSQLPAHIDPALFNIKLAWIEYINRLIGVSIGIFIFITMILAIRHYRKTPRVLWPTVGAFLGVGFEGWLGSKVVSSELHPLVVTLHLVAALIVVGLLIDATVNAFFPQGFSKSKISPQRLKFGRFNWAFLFLLLVQVILGTTLRGELDPFSQSPTTIPRSDWIMQTGLIYPIHRSFSIILVLLMGTLVYWTYKKFRKQPWLWRCAVTCSAILAIQILSGIGLAYLAIPPAMQIVHLFFGSLLIGALSVMIMLIYRLPESSAQATTQSN